MMMISVKSLLACFGLLLFMNVAVAQSQTVNMQECDIWARISDSDVRSIDHKGQNNASVSH
jgi:hypothetical protein